MESVNENGKGPRKIVITRESKLGYRASKLVVILHVNFYIHQTATGVAVAGFYF